MVFVSVLGLTACAAVAGASPVAVDAQTGEPRVDTGGGSPTRLLSRGDYVQESAGERFAIPPQRDPWSDDVDVGYGPIVSLYRADSVPNSLIIDRDGTIIERAIRGDQIVKRLEPLFAEVPESNETE